MNIKIGSVSLINNSYDAVVFGFPIEEIFTEKINIDEERTAFNTNGTYTIKKTNNVLSDNINYMIVTLSPNDYKRYYFITNIYELNGLLEINYEIDIFSTYFYKCDILNARIERSSVLNYLGHTIKSYKRPISLTGNLVSSYTSSLFPNINISKTNIYIILKTQITLNSTPVFSTGSVNYRCFVIDKSFNSLYDVQTFLTDIISGQRDRKIEYRDPGTQHVIEQYFYQIGQIYVVPKQYINEVFNNSSLVMKTGSGEEYLYTYIGSYPFNVVNHVTLGRSSAENIIGYGTIDNIKEYDGFAGENYEISQMTYLSAVDFAIYLLDKDGLMDITSSFEVDIPMTTMDGQTFAQIKTQKALQMLTGLFQIGSGIANTALTGGILGEMAGVGSGLLSPMSTIPKVVAGPNASSIMNRAILNEDNFKRNLIGSGISSMGGVLGGVKNIIQANEPFSSSKVNKTAPSGLVNLEYGICTLRARGDIIERQRKFIENTGYIVDEMMGNEIKFPRDTLGTDIIYGYGHFSYYYIKASYVQLVGDIPSDIKLGLCKILQNGIRVYVDYSSGE